MSVSMAWAKASSEPAPRRDKEEEEEDGLFKANAVNEDPGRDRATPA